MFGRESIEVCTADLAARVSHDGTAFTVTLASGTEVSGEALLVADAGAGVLTGATAAGPAGGKFSAHTAGAGRPSAMAGWRSGRTSCR